MKVELSIKDDKELRNMVKDLIRGQVASVTREEIKKILADSIGNSSIKAGLVESAERIARDAVREYVNEALGGFRRERTIRDMVKDYIASQVNIVLREKK